MDVVKAIQLEALANVLLPKKRADAEYFLRRVMRSYSERFHTPLHLVEQLPTTEVLLHYYEARYEDLLEDEKGEEILEEERALLCESDEERRERERAEREAEHEDEEYAKELERQLREAREKTAAQALLLAEQPPSQPVLSKAGPTAIPPPTGQPLRLPDDVKIEFVDAETLEREIQEDYIPRKRT